VEDRDKSGHGSTLLTTTSSLNLHGEVVSRSFPGGDTVFHKYDEKNTNPLDQGNLLEVRKSPAAGVSADHAELKVRYSYATGFQQIGAVIDPRGHKSHLEFDDRGNLTRRSRPSVTIPEVSAHAKKHTTRKAKLSESFEYNTAGQMIRSTDGRGASIEYFYHSAETPGGAKDRAGSAGATQSAGGYLARVVVDAAGKERRLKTPPTKISTQYFYDAFGNTIEWHDGKGNATHFQFDACNRLVERTSSQPFGDKRHFSYDANGNLSKATTTFDRRQYDPIERSIAITTTTLSRGFEYNALNNPVKRTVAGGGREVTHTLVRDSSENVVREILPMGNAFEYEYDERNLMTVKRSGTKTVDHAEIRHNYTRNGMLRSTTDAIGSTVRYEYDGHNRYLGLSDSVGTVKMQSLDESGNVIRVRVEGDHFSQTKRGKATRKKTVLLESWFDYDELNRRVRVDRAWNDPQTGESMGRSGWDGKEGVVSSVTEYGDNHVPLRVWSETGNIVNLDCDGANRPVQLSDGTGASVAVTYDENSNPTSIDQSGPAGGNEKERFRQVIKQSFDELNRLTTRSRNGAAAENFAYNALGLTTECKHPGGGVTQYLHDGLGRSAGQAVTAIAAASAHSKESRHILLSRVEWDDNNRLAARIGTAGERTKYEYDVRNRLRSVTYADGGVRHFERDGNGNIIRHIDPNQTVVTNQYDMQSRLIQRSIQIAGNDSPQLEEFQYDGVNRLVSAVTDSASTARRYDSLSRVLTETQSDRTVKYEYDSAGNRVRLTYPGGREIVKAYDSLRRVTEVREGSDGKNARIASYSYGSRPGVRQKQLGTFLKADFSYDRVSGRLSSVVYRSITTDDVVESYNYRYDDAGNRIEELQFRDGRQLGNRFAYDSANRLILARYGVKDMQDPASTGDREVSYELAASGLWQLKTIRDTSGQVLKKTTARADDQGRYRILGDTRFTYDANGNRTLEERGAEGDSGATKRRFRYDYANRLTGFELTNGSGQLVESLEYAYDTFNRQIRKRRIKGKATTEIRRTWDGMQLIEEYEKDRFARSFLHGARSNDPLAMDTHTHHETDRFFYTLDGDGMVTGLRNGGKGTVEQYSYDGDGRPFAGMDGAASFKGLEDLFPVSSIENPLLGNAQIWDSESGIYFNNQLAMDVVTHQSVNQALSHTNPAYPGASFRGGAPLTLTHSEQVSDYQATGQFYGGLAGAIVGGVAGTAVFVFGTGATVGAGTPAAAVAGFGVFGVSVGVGIGLGGAIGGYIGAHTDTGSQPPLVNVPPVIASDAGTSPVITVPVTVIDDVPDETADPPNGTIEVEGDFSYDAGGNVVILDPSTPSAGDSGSIGAPGGDAGGGDSGGGIPGGVGDSGGEAGGSDSGGGEGGGGGEGEGGGETGCFIGGTSVLLADGSGKPIEEMQIGDLVLSRDEQSGSMKAQRVSFVWIHEVRATLLLHLSNGKDVHTTKEHRFSVSGEGFVGAGDLQHGKLLDAEGPQCIEVASIEPRKQSATVYNLEVENFHTYFVGTDRLWVHNLKKADETGG
jgi:YD repeat-containing protein